MSATLDTPLGRVLEQQGRRRDWLAARLGLGPWTLSRYMRYPAKAPADFWSRAADLLGCDEASIRPEPPAPVEAAA